MRYPKGAVAIIQYEDKDPEGNQIFPAIRIVFGPTCRRRIKRTIRKAVREDGLGGMRPREMDFILRHRVVAR